MDCDSLIILQSVDVYYLTGTVQTGVLWFPREGEAAVCCTQELRTGEVNRRLKKHRPTEDLFRNFPASS